MKEQWLSDSELPRSICKTSRKRSRCCTTILMCSVAAVAFVRPVTSFLVGSTSPTSRTALQAFRSPVTERVEALVPKASSNKERREVAVKAMKRSKVETALEGVDAQMLELLSEQFLYPNSDSKSSEKDTKKTTRPRGRPDLVPGAMKFETMIRFQEHNGVVDGAHDLYSGSMENRRSDNSSNDQASSTAKAGKLRGFASLSTADALPEVGEGNNRRKRVTKNLPRKKESSEETPAPKKILKGRAKANNLELQKYYRTELLNAQEEYSLGMQIQFMVKCEEVHEGLATELMRLPTIKEWAEACGFVEHDTNFVTTEGIDEIRPAGCESMFDEIDPNKFVGNGLAQDAGPGRGRGRVTKPPPTKLRDFYDPNIAQPKKRQPLNRGTTTDFVDMMLDGRSAKQRMVQSNMRLVISIARKYSNVGVGLQDLVQEGSIGLSRAAEKFEPSKGFRFSTYASWWIQQAVFRSIAYHSRTIRLPVHVHNLLNRVRKVKSILERDLCRQPSNEEMAEALDMTLGKYNKMLRLSRRSISLELPKYQSNPKDLGHQSEDLLGESIPTTHAQEYDAVPEKGVDRGLFHDDLREMLQVLDSDEKEVIQYRYGLADGLTRTVTAVAAQMKQSKAWVRSQECKALRKLRRPWYEKKLKEHQEALSS